MPICFLGFINFIGCCPIRFLLKLVFVCVCMIVINAVFLFKKKCLKYSKKREFIKVIYKNAIFNRKLTINDLTNIHCNNLSFFKTTLLLNLLTEKSNTYGWTVKYTGTQSFMITFIICLLESFLYF